MNEMNGCGFTISCDECCMHGTTACDDCVVTFVLSDGSRAREPLILDLQQARAVRLLGQAGLVPGLRFRSAG